MNRSLTSFPADLRHSEDSTEMITHHKSLLEHYASSDEVAHTCARFLRGEQYTPEELKLFKAKSKSPVVFNRLKVFARTMVGAFLQNKYDVKFTPVEKGDSALAEVMEKVRIWQSGVCQDRKWIPDIVLRAYTMGRAYAECWMEVIPGKPARMHTKLLPTLAVHWDPESRDLISRKDAAFVDVDSWMSIEQLIDAFPARKELILSGAIARASSEGFEAVPDIEKFQASAQYRNGRHRVVERYYKVRKKKYFAFVDGARIEIQRDDIPQFEWDYPDARVYNESGMELYLAVAAEGLGINKYLFNGPYHCTPLDPATNEMMWPIVELVAESIEGVPQGFIEPMIDPARLYNAMMANLAHSSKHASSQAKLIDASGFISDEEAKLAATHHSDADMGFFVRPGRVNDSIKPIEHSSVTVDTYRGMSFAAEFMQDVSSTPPAMQGIQEGANTSGRLNQQRIEQSYVQLQTFVSNYRTFLEVLYKLRYSYTREYYDDEMVIRITQEGAKGDPEELTLNATAIEPDGRGGARLTTLNDVNSMIFDITVEDSTRTPTFRAQLMSQITDLIQSNAVANDPVLGAALFGEFVEVSDLSPETKEMVHEYNTLMRQNELNRKTMELQKAQVDAQLAQLNVQQQQQQLEVGETTAELNQMGQLQQLAQNEAEQTFEGAFPPM